MELKAFARATVRTATAIFLALLALIATVAGVSWAKATYEERQAKPYETIHEWKVDMREPLALDVRGKTKLVGNKLLASFEVAGYPQYMSAPKNQSAQLIFEFLDSDGFRVLTKPVAISEFMSIVGKDGKPTGLQYQLEDNMTLDTYKRISQLQVGWTLDVQATPVSAPAPAPAPVAAPAAHPSAEPTLDHCAPGLSRAERLRRLAQHGPVREVGKNMYSAGMSSIYFFSTGELLNCR